MKPYSFLQEVAIAKFAGNAASKIVNNPIKAGAAVGATAGALKKDENGERHIIKGAVSGGAKGAMVGAGARVANAGVRKVTGGKFFTAGINKATKSRGFDMQRTAQAAIKNMQRAGRQPVKTAAQAAAK